MDLDKLDDELRTQENNLNVLQECLKNINSSIQNIDNFEDSQNATELLRELKTNLDTCRNNINNLENLKNMKNSLNEIEYNKYDELLNDFSTSLNTSSNNINNFLLKYINNTSFSIDKNITIGEIQKPITQENITKLQSVSPTPSTYEFVADKSFINNIINNSKGHQNFSINNDYIKDKIINKVENNPNSVYFDDINTIEDSDNLEDNNVLLISERKNKIFLPYKIKKLNEILEHSSRFDNIQQIINKKYIIPLDRHKNGIISRFKETYNFMRKKEKASILDSLDLALELAFNYKLNPAVILACNNLEELDTYLDCLELDELEKFNYFEVKYEFLPRKR